MIVKEFIPILRRWPPSPSHVFGNRGLADVDPGGAAGLGVTAATTAADVLVTQGVDARRWDERVAELQRIVSTGQVLGLLASRRTGGSPHAARVPFCRSGAHHYHRRCRAGIREGVVALRVRNSVTECPFLAPVSARRFCNGPLISHHFRRPVTPEVAGSSPVAPAMISSI
jgi:hypothetical protein